MHLALQYFPHQLREHPEELAERQFQSYDPARNKPETICLGMIRSRFDITERSNIRGKDWMSMALSSRLITTGMASAFNDDGRK